MPPQPREDKTRNTTLAIALDMLAEVKGQAWLPINGESMAPIIRHGDQVLVDFNPESARLGEVVLIQNDDELITHRLLKISATSDKGTNYLTKGDNLTLSDPVTYKESLKGKVIAIRREERVLWLHTRPWQYMNWLIARIMLAETIIFQIFQRWLGDHKNLRMRFLARMIKSGNHAGLRLIQFIASRKHH